MALCSLDDVNVHLPTDKIELLDAVDEAIQLDAERMVKGHLAGIYAPETLAAWDTPETTPQLIRAIAGRFIAAHEYARRYSEDIPDVPEYSQWLYNGALTQLTQIKTGELVIPEEETGEVVDVGSRLTPDDFYPNASAPDPVFAMDSEF